MSRSILKRGFYFATGLLIGAILNKEVILKMTNYVVTKAFQDKITGENYGIGQSYSASNEGRATELEKAGFIAAENSQGAQMAKQSSSQTTNQTNSQSNNQAAAEPMTIINGKAVPVSQANQAMEAAEAAQSQTGVQAHHDNSTEAVQAGQTAQQSSAQTQQTQVNVRQANVQSGGEHLESHMNSQGAESYQSAVASGMGTSTTSAESQEMTNEQTQQSAEKAAQQSQQQSATKAARTKKAD
jgi:hypothetical protein